MKSIIINIDGSAIKFSKTRYIQYLRDNIKGKVMFLDYYNAKDLGVIRNINLDREDDLRYELKTIKERK